VAGVFRAGRTGTGDERTAHWRRAMTEEQATGDGRPAMGDDG